MIPPLRERREDLPKLTDTFLHRFAAQLGRPLPTVEPAAMELFRRYPWPGNVRELQNVIERALILADSDVLTLIDLEEVTPTPAKDLALPKGDRLPLSIEEYTKEIIVLYQDRYGEAELAALLGIGRKALWVRRRHWGLYRQRDPIGAGAETSHPNDNDTRTELP